ncbi:S8 family serine peptidase [Actinoallomurus spadix]|uniref:S8 family serine peptidase n=1 Tax=Actinoallomurus spadix TaxID=79912 RepID=A0ABP3FLA2_9ACTN|nr:S8 family serine peptidase [Actinoallomurus spadix]MCO5985820.1 S8 family serine peptidase [Actinoallomurus spadix]
MRPRRSLSAAAILLLAAGLAQARPAAAATVAPAAGGDGRTATLISGDRVTLTRDGGVSVVPGPGRAKIPMLTSTVSGHVRVVPADAVPLLRAKRLDPRLFDVTGLLADGYNDRRADLPIIASTDSGVTGTVVHRMTSVKATAVHTRKRDLGRLWSRVTRKGATGKVWLDAIGHFTGAEGVQQIGAPDAWHAGLTGKGITVGLIDSGVDVTHPDLAGRVAAQVDFTPVADGGEPTSGDVHDVEGHGTNVASVLAGNGAASGGRYRGVAPDATIVSAKVGDGEPTESAVIAGMEWAAGTEHAAVVNISLAFADAPGDDPLESTLNNLSEQYGTLFVVGAGNDGDNGANPNGADDYDVASPSTADDALSVGAVDHDDRLAAFSNRGPRPGDNAIKPEITAPGVDVTVARSADSSGTGPYRSGVWGTSEAAPHVAGSAALLKQKHPDWTGAMLKAALMGTARPAQGVGVFAQGAGRVDVAGALADPVLADPPSLSMGTATYPHTDDTALTKAVTYRNPGTTAQTLRLALTVDGPNMTATSGLFSLSTSTLTVPAGGSAQVKVTAAASTAAPNGPYSGQLTATTADGTKVTTPVGLIREAATHTLTLHHLGADGQPTAEYYTTVVGLDTPYEYDSLFHYDRNYGSDFTISVPEGHYAIVSQMFSALPNETYVARPNLTVDTDTDLTLDERAGQPVRVSVPTAGAVRSDSAVEVGIRNGSNSWVTVGGSSNESIQMRTAQIGGSGDSDAFVSEIRTAFSDGSDPSAYAYQLAWYRPGTLPTGFTESVTADQLAVDRTSARAQAPAGTTIMQSAPTVPGYPLSPVYTSTPLAATRYFNTDGGISWTSQAYQYSEDSADYYTVTTTGPPTAYQAGRSYTSTWNAPIIAPCPTTGGGWTGDQLTVRVGPYCDSAGNAGYVDQATAAGTTTLYRDGKEVATSDVPGHARFTAQPTAGAYRLNVDSTRAASFGLSTHVTADWTFTDPAAAAHLTAIRMAPALDATGTAPAGRAFTVPIIAAATAVTMQVSYDDGATWQSATVTRTGTGAFRATIRHPAASGYVSLKVHATGGTATLTETIAHAYRIGS